MIGIGLDLPTLALRKLSGTTPVIPEVQQFLDRTTGLDATHVSAYTNLITSLVDNSLWSLIDILHIFATQDTTNAALNLKSSNFSITAPGNYTFTANSGYVSATSGDTLRTGFNPATAVGANFLRDSAHYWTWTLSATAQTAAVGTQNNTAIANYIYAQYSDNRAYVDINASSDDLVGSVVASAAGLTGGSRTAAAGYDVYRNTTSRSVVNTSAALVNGDLRYCGKPQVAGGGAGAGLNATQWGNLYSAVHTYMQTIAGAP